MSQKQTLGILGGGQLGRMLLQSAVDFDLQVRVLDPDPSAPCAEFSPDFTQGDFHDEAAVLAWAGAGLDRLTIEIEHVSVSALAKLEAQGVIVSPSSKVISLVQDKRKQKRFYQERGFPTAAFQEVFGLAQIKQVAAEGRWVFKTAEAGYDGKGVFVLNGDFSGVPDVPGLVEEAVEIDKELAVLVARSQSGEILAYDPVEMVFDPKLNLVDVLIAPAQISPQLAEDATRLAIRLVEELNVVGLLAVEMFLTPKGELIINEVAPRPHNSGHHTIHACETSQFEQHLRAVMGWSLGSTKTLVPAVMVNLLGEPGHEGLATYEGLEEVLAIPGAHVVLYGKKDTKPGRKMGHVTLTGPDLAKLRENAEVVRRTLRIIATQT